MNGDFKPIEQYIDDLDPDEQVFAIFYLLEKMKQYIPVEKIIEIFVTLQDGVSTFRSLRTHAQQKTASRKKTRAECSIKRL